MDQDAGDESVQDMLRRLAGKKVRLMREDMIPRAREAVSDPNWQVAGLPQTWQAICLGQACGLVTSGSRGWAEYYSKSGPGFVRAQNIRFGRLRLDDLACVNPPASVEGSRTQVAQGDLLIVITGAGVTNPALMDRDLGEAYVSQHVGLVRPIDTEMSPWLLLCLMADSGGRSELVARAYGAGKPGLNLENIRCLTVPIPPSAEQVRILNRVDQLMSLCDRLEANLHDTAATRSRLLDALLAEALAPASAPAPRVEEALLHDAV